MWAVFKDFGPKFTEFVRSSINPLASATIVCYSLYSFIKIKEFEIRKDLAKEQIGCARLLVTNANITQRTPEEIHQYSHAVAEVLVVANGMMNHSTVNLFDLLRKYCFLLIAIFNIFYREKENKEENKQETQ